MQGADARGKTNRHAIWLGVAVAMVVVLGALGLSVAHSWREGILDFDDDCRRSFAASPLYQHGATIELASGTDGAACSYGFALQRTRRVPERYVVDIEGLAINRGEVEVTVSAFSWLRRVERQQRIYSGPNRLANLRFELDVPATARGVEVVLRARGGATVEASGLHIRAQGGHTAGTSVGAALSVYGNGLDLVADHALQFDHLPKDFRERWRPVEDATPAQARAALRTVLGALGDGHSFLMDPAQRAQLDQQAQVGYAAPGWQMLDGQVGLLRVPGFLGDAAAAERYAAALAGALAEGEAQGARGWVLDLRDNSGGNMWPMLAGLEPLLRGQSLGSFRDRKGAHTPWRNEGAAAAQAVADLGNAPVAVLTANRTASSGEAVVVAFRGRPHTRSFGVETRGLSTGNMTYTLADGSLMALTTTVYVDRTGQPYGGAIPPDEPAPDDAKERARRWIMEAAASNPR